MRLFAQHDGGGISVLTLLIGGAVLLLMHWWLYRIGFYGKFVRAALQTAGVLTVGGIGTMIFAGCVGKADDVGQFVSANLKGTLLMAALASLGMIAFFYRQQVPVPAAPLSVETESHVEAEVPQTGASSGHCRKCQGTGETSVTCSACSGVGETQCTYEKTGTAWFTGEEFAWEWCDGGFIHYKGQPARSSKICTSCNGRGFRSCYSCGASGKVTATCSKCQGKG